jgi:hypothetical protein
LVILKKDIAMKKLGVFAIATAFSTGSAISQVNMQYSGQVSERYSGQYSGQWSGQVNEQVDGRADRDRSRNCKLKRIAPVDRTHINYAQSMDAVMRPLLEQRKPRY